MTIMEEVVLFASSSSRTCVPCLKFIRANGLPVHVVLLDSSSERERVKSGKLFKITTVPSLMVRYEDENLQIFEGARKVMAWLSSFSSYVSPSQQQEEEEVQAPTVIEEPNTEEIETPVDIVFIDAPPTTPDEQHPKLAGIKGPPRSSMMSIIEEAKRMERIRDKATEITGEEKRQAAKQMMEPRISTRHITK
jgi:hypothetical protein